MFAIKTYGYIGVLYLAFRIFIMGIFSFEGDRMMVGLAIVLYLIRMLAIGIATGIAFIKLGLFPKMKNWEVLTIGVCVSPMFASLMNYLLGLVFIGWSSVFFYTIPLTLAVIWIVYEKNYELPISILKEGKLYVKEYMDSLGKWLVVDIVLIMAGLTLFVALFDGYSISLSGIKKIFSAYPHLFIMLKLNAIILGLLAVSFVWQWFSDEKRREAILAHLIFIATFLLTGSIVLFGWLHNHRPVVDTDQSHYELDARYFMADRNSWNIDDYKDERYGSSLRDDHGPLWITALVDPRLASDVAGLERPLRVSNLNMAVVYACFTVLLFLTAAIIVGTPKAGIIAILLFGLNLEEIRMILCYRDAFRFDALLLLYLYVSNNYFLFVKGQRKWYHYVFLAVSCYLSMNGHASNVYVMLGMFLCMMVSFYYFHAPSNEMVLCGMAALFGTLIGMMKNISIYIRTGRLASSTMVAFHGTVIERIVQQNVALRENWAKIFGTYTPLVKIMMIIGIIGLLCMIIMAWKKKEKSLFVWSLLMAGMLLPLTGIMDWIGYKCSVWFFYQGRYRMYFLMIFSIAGSWLLFYPWRRNAVKIICAVISVIVFLSWGYIEGLKFEKYSQKDINLAQKLEREYNNVATRVEELSTGDAFDWAQTRVYYHHGTPKILFHMYSESLIQAKTEQEIKEALHNLRVGTILLGRGGIGRVDYSLLPFWDYINEEFICISSTEFGDCVIFVNPEFIKNGAF